MVWFWFDVVWENNWFPREMTWAGRNERRNSILMTRHYPDLGSVAHRSWRVGNLLQPIISTSQIRVVTHLFISMKFLYSFPRRHFARKPAMLGLRNVGCFLKRDLMLFKCNKWETSIIFFFKGNKINQKQSQNMLTLIFAKTISPLTWRLLMLPGVTTRGTRKGRHFSSKLIKCKYWLEMGSLTTL